MAKFFRGIRQKLINDGKTGRYLKYAIGEIVLVVIGILIALQINNWNDERKAAIVDEALRKEYIRDLYSEMQNTIYQLEGIIDQFKRSKEGAEYLLNSIENDSLKIKNMQNLQDAQRKLLERFNTDQTRTYNVNQTTVYDEMRSSGKLTKVKDDTLTALLEDFYSQRKLREPLFESLEKTTSELADFISKNSPLDEQNISFNKGIWNFKFMKKLLAQEGYYKPVRKIHATSIFGGINSYLSLKDKAHAILDYMNERYSDILKDQ